MDRDRRSFLQRTAAASMAAFAPIGAALSPLAALPQEAKKKEDSDEDVAPAEDLMREHGVLNRILLVYDHYENHLRGAKADLDPSVLNSAAGIIQHFIEDYHEKLEEDHLFPRFEKAGKLVPLVKTLRQQHQAGRALTARILDLTKSGSHPADEDRAPLRRALRQFIRMYRPHEAREDTVLFPAIRSIVSAHEYAALGEDFEDKEHELFGKEGFEGIVEQVGMIEKKLGLYELSQFTPRT